MNYMRHFSLLISFFSVMIQRRAIYEDLHRALTIMKYIDEKTSKNKVFHAMWLLETKSLLTTVNIEVSSIPFFQNIISYEFLKCNFFLERNTILNDS